jgi:adenosylmethionine-8-amino-7-oxononanoate aminotransferase
MTEAEHQRLVELDHRHLWHPFTQMQGWLQEEPLIIERGEGSFLIDTKGRRYLDGISSLWVNVHGHRRAEVDQAIADQLGKIAHTTMLGLSSVPAIELAAKLVALAPPSLTRVFFSDDGSSAAEVALKMAFQHWRLRGKPEKRRFLALGEAYHGDTLGSVSAGGIELFHQIFKPLLFEVMRTPPPYCYRCPLGLKRPSCQIACAAEAERLIADHADELAAVIVEPLVQGAAGMIMQPPGYLARLRAACDKHGVLLIADEVAVGCGRTGTFFACEQENVRPDLLCVAKGLTAGYLPVAATLATEQIFESFLGSYESQRTFFHGHSYTGNALGAVAALANLEIFERERTIEKLAPKIALLENELAPLQSHAHVGEVRQRGLMVGIEVVEDRETRRSYPAALRMGHRIIREARERGVILRPLGDVVVLMPPLSISAEELLLLTSVTRESIEAATAAASR